MGDAAVNVPRNGVVSISSENRRSTRGVSGAALTLMGLVISARGGCWSSSAMPREATTVHENSLFNRSPDSLPMPNGEEGPPASVMM